MRSFVGTWSVLLELAPEPVLYHEQVGADPVDARAPGVCLRAVSGPQLESFLVKGHSAARGTNLLSISTSDRRVEEDHVDLGVRVACGQLQRGDRLLRDVAWVSREIVEEDET